MVRRENRGHAGRPLLGLVQGADSSSTISGQTVRALARSLRIAFVTVVISLAVFVFVFVFFGRLFVFVVFIGLFPDAKVGGLPAMRGISVNKVWILWMHALWYASLLLDNDRLVRLL